MKLISVWVKKWMWILLPNPHWPGVLSATEPSPQIFSVDLCLFVGWLARSLGGRSAQGVKSAVKKRQWNARNHRFFCCGELFGLAIPLKNQGWCNDLLSKLGEKVLLLSYQASRLSGAEKEKKNNTIRTNKKKKASVSSSLLFHFVAYRCIAITFEEE